MSWDLDRAEMEEAVREGDVEFLWGAYRHACEERHRIFSKYQLALSLLRQLRKLYYEVMPHLQQDRADAYEAIVALADGFTPLTSEDPDAWPVVASTSMILGRHMRVINAALAYKGRKAT